VIGPEDRESAFIDSARALREAGKVGEEAGDPRLIRRLVRNLGK
jgi:hypothetical protein